MLKKALDKDLGRIVRLELATQESGRRLALFGLAGLFLALVWSFAAEMSGGLAASGYVVLAAVAGGYMALNIGANDVANNMGPAVGAKAITLLGALALAAVAEAAGALLAGSPVVETVAKSIIDPSALGEGQDFILMMTAALLAAALWINLGTAIGAPVSTTHAIVGAVLGGGLAAAGPAAADWAVLGAIALSWVVSPVLGGLIAALLLHLLDHSILRQADKIAAAARWVPRIVALMAAAFTYYLMTKGLKGIWRPGAVTLLLGTLLAAGIAYGLSRPAVARRARFLENRKKAVGTLFVMPLVFAATLLSFAHGANDVANAVGPLAAVVGAATSGSIEAKVTLPYWVMVIGALGISLGLLLFGPRLIQRVGQEITRLNPVRAFCIALSAAVTVIAASNIGLPVSSTHIAVGGVFGVGLFREARANRRRHGPASEPLAAIFGREPSEEELWPDDLPPGAKAEKLGKSRRRRLVRRRHALTIVAAWVVTVPLTALISALLYLGAQALAA